MGISLFLKSIGLSVAIAFIAFAFVGSGLLFLAKALALALGVSIVFALVYPHVRGIKKGDKISVITNNTHFIFGFGRTGFALDNSGLHKEVRIRLDDGKEAIGIVESYESIFSPPKVRIFYEERFIE